MLWWYCMLCLWVDDAQWRKFTVGHYTHTVIEGKGGSSIQLTVFRHVKFFLSLFLFFFFLKRFQQSDWNHRAPSPDSNLFLPTSFLLQFDLMEEKEKETKRRKIGSHLFSYYPIESYISLKLMDTIDDNRFCAIHTTIRAQYNILPWYVSFAYTSI